MDIQLNLKKHCIATECKRLYNQSVSSYLKKAHGKPSLEEKNLEERIELLKTSLEQLDFPGLRSKYPALSGKTDSQVRLGSNSGGNLFISIDNLKIELLFLS